MEQVRDSSTPTFLAGHDVVLPWEMSPAETQIVDDIVNDYMKWLGSQTEFREDGVSGLLERAPSFQVIQFHQQQLGRTACNKAH